MDLSRLMLASVIFPGLMIAATEMPTTAAKNVDTTTCITEKMPIFREDFGSSTEMPSKIEVMN